MQGEQYAVPALAHSAHDANIIDTEVLALSADSSQMEIVALHDNLPVITTDLHRNVHRLVACRPCGRKDLVDYLLLNHLTHFEGSPGAHHDQRQRKRIHHLELCQARYKGNRLLS